MHSGLVLRLLRALWQRLSRLLRWESKTHLGIGALLQHLSLLWKLLRRGRANLDDTHQPRRFPSGREGYGFQKGNSAEGGRSESDGKVEEDVPYTLIDAGNLISTLDQGSPMHSSATIPDPKNSLPSDQDHPGTAQPTPDITESPTNAPFRPGYVQGAGIEDRIAYDMQAFPGDNEDVSLHGTAASAYPFSGSSIRNPSQASVNLQTASEAHERNVLSSSRSISRNASPLSNNRSSPSGYAISAPSLQNEFIAVEVEDEDVQGPSAQAFLGTDLHPSRRSSSNGRPTPITDLDVIEVDVAHEYSSSFGGRSQMLLARSHIRPVMPNATQRYSKRPIIDRHSPNIMIKPLTTSFTDPGTPSGWILCAHPEGARYFYHEEKKIYSDADLLDSRIFNRATEDILDIEELVSTLGAAVPRNRHLVIDLNYGSSGDIQTIYYFVDHDTRSVFFLDLFDSTSMDAWYEASGCMSMKHLGYEIEAQYWYFVNLFPDSIPLSRQLISELRDMTHHNIGDTVTAPQTIAPFPLEYLEKIANWTASLDRNLGENLSTIGSTSLLARIFYTYVHARFIHFHGEAHARLERETSVYTRSRPEETWFIRIASLFLFRAPYVHLRALQKIWVDKVMHKSIWEDAIKKLNGEWAEFVLFGAVLLNVNVGFLSIPSVNVQSTMEGAPQSPVQIASYISTAASIGSVLLGLLLIRQYRAKVRESADDVQIYLNSKNHPLLGLESLAIIQSLPYALLMWSIATFLVAFCLHCFLTTDLKTRVIVGSLCAAVASLLLWQVFNAWETQPESDSGSRRAAARFKQDFLDLVDRVHIPSMQNIPFRARRLITNTYLSGYRR